MLPLVPESWEQVRAEGRCTISGIASHIRLVAVHISLLAGKSSNIQSPGCCRDVSVEVCAFTVDGVCDWR